MSWQTLREEALGELEDRNSRFLAFLVPIDRFEDRLTELRAEHRKANHHVTAFRRVLDDDRIEEGAKDDGEPAGTSGMPTLRVLQGAELVDAGVIVVRYFGGIKLGGGGLARAYSGAAARAIEAASLTPWLRFAQRTVRASFAEAAKLEQAVSNFGLNVMARDFSETGVSLTVQGPEGLLDQLEDALSSR